MPVKGSSLDSWLQYISKVHPREIELGLERTQIVAQRLDIVKPAPLVVTIAGTNGKGSCVASLEALLQQSGLRSAAYTSPHLLLFNERIRINAACACDADIVAAFERVDSARGQESLSYFEFATLAALYLFKKAAVDIALLEVGLGGRLDSVNIVDADLTIISSIAVDHIEWLGNNIESIAAEKAGIMRSETPLIYGEPEVPKAITDKAATLNAPLYVLGREYSYFEELPDTRWSWKGIDLAGEAVELSALPVPKLGLGNVSIALQALQLLPLDPKPASIEQALLDLRLSGRFDCRTDKHSGRKVILDVAHNPDAMKLLAANLGRYRQQNGPIERIIAVIAMMADKDVEGMLTALESCVDIWYIAQVDEARGVAADKVAQILKTVRIQDDQLTYLQFDTVESAYEAACKGSNHQDIIVVTGSFFTVAAVQSLIEQA